MRGFETPEGTSAAFVFTFHAPRATAAGSRHADEAVAGRDRRAGAAEPEATAWARALLKNGKWIEGSEEFAPHAAAGGCDAALPPAPVVYKHWITAEGVRHVGIGFTRAAPWSELCQTLSSMENRYRPVERLVPGGMP
jgi:hypothetical protein